MLDGRPADCNRVVRAFDNGWATASTPSYAPGAGGMIFVPVTNTRTLQLGSDGRISDTTTPGGVPGGSSGGYSQNWASWPVTTWIPVQGPQQNPLAGWPNPPIDVNGVKNTIAEWLANERCAKFISAVMAGLAKKKLANGTDVLKLFEDVRTQGGFVRGTPPDKSGQLAGGTFRGSIEKKNATIYLPGFDPRGRPAQSQVNLNDAGGIFHELLHLATKKPNDDKQLAKVIRDAGFGVTDLPKDKDNKNLAFSHYNHDAIAAHCGTP